jgi:membrane protein implicated in regulation of membrane protease activity
MTSAGSSPIGLAGRITTPTRGQEGAGEVEVRIRGGTETFIARSATPLGKGQAVIVVQTLGPRTVIVMPWADPVDSLLEL